MSYMDSSAEFKYQALIGLIAPAILLVQILFISQSFDTLTLLDNPDVYGWKNVFAYFGDVAKILTLSSFVYLMLSWSRIGGGIRKVISGISAKRFIPLISVQVLAYILVFSAADSIYSDPGEVSDVSSKNLLFFFVGSSFCGVISILSIAKLDLILDFMAKEKIRLFLAITSSIFIWWVSSSVRGAWNGLSEHTFSLVRVLLGGYSEDYLYIDLENKDIGVGDFVVSIDPACSGYEGIGLIFAFTSIYLLVNRKDINFPLAFILYPIGLLLIWFLNGVRIALLVAIGYHFSPEIAVGGFHSQAGWITFIAGSIFILWLSGKSRFIRSDINISKNNRLNLSISTLIPMITLLSVTLITSAFYVNFDYLYPLRVISVAISIAVIWRYFKEIKIKPTLLGSLVAVFVSVTWILISDNDQEANKSFEIGFDSMGSLISGVWIFFRFFGAVLTVPVAEELAFRGYVISRLSMKDVVVNGKIEATVFSVIGSSVAFGFLHGDWMAGIIAGLSYALVRIKGSGVGEAIFSHSMTNAILFIYASRTESWWLI